MKNMPSDTTTDAWIMLHRANRKLLEEVGSALKRNDLPPLDWYDILLELRRAGDEGLRQFAIGQKVLLAKHNLSRLIDRLEKQGLVQRETSSEDGRGNIVKITDAGRALLKRVWPVYGQSIQREFGDKLSEAESKALTRLLGKIMAERPVDS